MHGPNTDNIVYIICTLSTVINIQTYIYKEKIIPYMVYFSNQRTLYTVQCTHCLIYHSNKRDFIIEKQLLR